VPLAVRSTRRTRERQSDAMAMGGKRGVALAREGGREGGRVMCVCVCVCVCVDAYLYIHTH
jgi:hypothetical protein